MANPWSKEEYIFDFGAIQKIYDTAATLTTKSPTLQQYYSSISVGFVKPIQCAQVIGNAAIVTFKLAQLKKQHKQQKLIQQYSIAVSATAILTRITDAQCIIEILKSISMFVLRLHEVIKERATKTYIILERSLHK